jgi:TctA family transporter
MITDSLGLPTFCFGIGNVLEVSVKLNTKVENEWWHASTADEVFFLGLILAISSTHSGVSCQLQLQQMTPITVCLMISPTFSLNLVSNFAWNSFRFRCTVRIISTVSGVCRLSDME